MSRGASALGVIAGVLLGLAVVAISGQGLVPFMAQGSHGNTGSQTSQEPSEQTTSTAAGGTEVAPSSATGSSTSTAVSHNTGNGEQNSEQPTKAGAYAVAQVENLGSQPAARTAAVFLPVLAAFAFGFIAYRSSRNRFGEEPTSSL